MAGSRVVMDRCWVVARWAEEMSWRLFAALMSQVLYSYETERCSKEGTPIKISAKIRDISYYQVEAFRYGSS